MLFVGRAYIVLWLAAKAALGAIYFRNPTNLPAMEYDFIVVGGGTAGATVATRLGENHHFKVLVIEAGPSNDDIFESHVPGLAFSLPGTRVDWNYTVVPQPGINDGLATPYSRAKMLGGCSSHNIMTYTRGSSDDYDRWASVIRDNKLSWDNMYPYILKTEKWTRGVEHQDMRGHFDPSLHSRTGKVSVSAGYLVHPFNGLLLNATTELGHEFPFKLDMNDGRPIGIGWVQNTIDGDGMRSSSATGYLASTGTNVHVLLNTVVIRIIPTNGGGTDFRKVEFAPSTGGSRSQLTAKKEVILSGGVIGTPQVLLNSGIGSKAELEPLGVKTLVDNPSVGKNFTDQAAVIITFGVNITVTEFDPTAALTEWNKTHTGPLSRPGPLSRAAFPGLIGWVRLPEDAKPFKDGLADPSAGVNSPHIELIPLGITSRANAIPGTVPPSTAGTSDPNVVLQVFVTNLNPVSRGSISLASSDPFSKPNVDLQLLKEPIDIAIIREGIRSARRLFSAPAWEAKVFGTVAPPANATTDQDLDAFIKQGVAPFAHGVGSAGMSPKGAKWGVIDPDFTVKNTKGLRVVDASVFPYVTCGHTQAPIYALAERASDLIRRAWD